MPHQSPVIDLWTASYLPQGPCIATCSTFVGLVTNCLYFSSNFCSVSHSILICKTMKLLCRLAGAQAQLYEPGIQTVYIRLVSCKDPMRSRKPPSHYNIYRLSCCLWTIFSKLMQSRHCTKTSWHSALKPHLSCNLEPSVHTCSTKVRLQPAVLHS